MLTLRPGRAGYLECGGLREVLQRSYHRPVRRRHLEGEAVSGGIAPRVSMKGKEAAHDDIPPRRQTSPKGYIDDMARLEREYYTYWPDVGDPTQRVSFCTSGHRGSPLHGSFTEAHILAITQAICDYRHSQGTDGPLYMGKDTHALSGPAQRTGSRSWLPTGWRPSSSATTV